MLMDVNIFWRVLKLVYSMQYAACNVRGELAECVPVLGIWHAHAHSVKKVYEHFMPFFAALDNRTIAMSCRLFLLCWFSPRSSCSD